MTRRHAAGLQHTGRIITATLVRALLAPATMRLLGRWNWWAPGRSAGSTGGTGSREAPQRAESKIMAG